MIRYILLVSTLLFITACSFKTPVNDWQINSVNAYDSYKKYYLKAEDNLANTDIKRAVKYAKQSADLDTLAKIYLSECALHISVLEDDNCEKYQSLTDLARSDEMQSYYLFLQNSITEKDIKNLPSKYRDFALYKLKNDYENADKEIHSMDDIVSKMISASLIKESLHVSTIKSIIDEASFHGYKKAVINWMKFYETKVNDKNERDLINKKLKILND